VNKELEIWQFAAERLKRNESVVLLVVAESSGSSPGRQGFKMIVAEDDLIGSIGGGVMEVSLVQQARDALKKNRREAESEKTGFVKMQVHRKNSPNPSGMICSGKQTIILRKLTKDDLRIVQKIIQYLKNNRQRYLQITESKFQTRWHKRNNFDFNFTVNNPHSLEAHVNQVRNFAGEEISKPIQNDTEIETDISNIFVFLYEEKLGCKNKLYIIGGGHCALALSEIMSKMDFHITLLDDRPNLNTIEKNEFVHAKQIVESYQKIDDFVPAGANHFVVVMTLGYKSDQVVIKQLLDKNFKYFGVLGSLGKMAMLLKELKKEGLSEKKLNQIHTPIGLPINSRTPEEIAVSIAAEIIRVKNAQI
jgi:xanthine dehydrogenase accessory factor